MLSLLFFLILTLNCAHSSKSFSFNTTIMFLKLFGFFFLPVIQVFTWFIDPLAGLGTDRSLKSSFLQEERQGSCSIWAESSCSVSAEVSDYRICQNSDCRHAVAGMHWPEEVLLPSFWDRAGSGAVNIIGTSSDLTLSLTMRKSISQSTSMLSCKGPTLGYSMRCSEG